MTVAVSELVPTKLAKLMVYLEPELKSALENLSNVERRSMSQMAAYLVEQGIMRAIHEGKIPPIEKEARSQQ